jgi:bacillolysin
MKKNSTLLASAFLSACSVFAQVKESEIISKNWRGDAELISFNSTVTRADDASIKRFLKAQFNHDDQTVFREKRENSLTENRFSSQKYQQFYQGIQVEHGIQNVVSSNGLLTAISGRFVYIQDLSTLPSLNENQALSFALKTVGAKEYMWENKDNEAFIKQEQKNPSASYYPKGELVIVEKDLLEKHPVPTLAYKFSIYATAPLSRNLIYIDANTGETILVDPIIKHVAGTGDTRYSGQRSIQTQQTSATEFKLRDYTRGQGVETYNMKKSTNYFSAVDFTDNNNNWTAAEFNNAPKDNAALDAHWGAEQVYDYFLAKHARNSYDNNGATLKNYVHYSVAHENAYWDGQVMTYGDGGSLFYPLTSLDVIAHEIGHAVCSSTCNLVYKGEPGAINEGLSDIWGAIVEYYAAPTKQAYLIGEDIKIGGGALRSMSNPKSLWQPNTYGGTYWVNPACGLPTNSNDYCGVHSNSGVINQWFYIVAEGKAGTNDLWNAYNVIGIGKEKAAKIIYRAEAVYFTSTTSYLQARNATIQAAKDLYGATSIEAVRVCQAWYAVGVGNNVCGISSLALKKENESIYVSTTSNSLASLEECANITYELVTTAENQFSVKQLTAPCDKSTGNQRTADYDDAIKITVYDYQGKEVLSTSQNELSLAYLHPGVYIVKLLIKNQPITKKVVVH